MHTFCFFLILAATGYCSDVHSKIHGHWKSDLKQTSEYLQKHSKLDEHQKKGLGILFGRAVITFNADGTGSVVKEEFTIPTDDGRKLPMGGTKSNFSYTVVGESEGQVVVRLLNEDPATAKCPFVVMRFDGRDDYSVEIGDNPFALSGREFFRRTETKAEQGGAGQPATRPESDSEGGDKPQPESEGRSR